MVQINFAQKSVTVKIVYYGPGMSGKTTNLEIVHERAPDTSRGELTSISTEGDRTLFFDFMPLDLGTVAGMRTQFQIYTVPGQVYYNSTRKLVLQGVDGVIFIADSSASMMDENKESLANLKENLAEYGKGMDEIPVVIQYNKRDLPDALPVETLQAELNPHGWPSFEGIASSGQGVFPTLKGLAAVVLDSIHEQSGGGAPRSLPTSTPEEAPAPVVQEAPAAPMPAPAPAYMAEAPAESISMAAEPAAPVPAPMAEAPPVQVPVEQHMGAPSLSAPIAPIEMQTPPLGNGFAAPNPPPAGTASSLARPGFQAPTPALGDTGFHQPPAAPAAPQLAQTGFHQPPAAPAAPQLAQTGFHQPPPPAAPSADLTQTGFHQSPAPEQGMPELTPSILDGGESVAPEASPLLRMAGPGGPPSAPAPAPNFAPAPPAAAAPASAPMPAPMPAPVAAVPPAAAPAPAAAAPRPAQQATRLKPRTPAATPAPSASRGSITTVLFVAVALAVGVALGGLAFNLF
ncbi:MAG: signal recognition particle receptor subunit beta [Planctomycetota bacterium]|jgi:signal recognition particle receptor subunit beta